ncbi:DoxX family protein [Sessilibacter corallicola]|uniref:DoxX family protein n=1 Tax=Sessilibacter corallicola TaxID=2904075 RepID=A0ABQ0ADC3_9GAMM|nr:DoxX family protein [Sessilibacter corallicola]MCE2027506.1 DoxX family protein [Sessilibacter corallicola]
MTTTTLNPVNTVNQANLSNLVDLIGRIALAAIFFLSGVGKLQNYEGSQQFLALAGLPEFLLPAVIVFEIVGSLLLVAGFQTRLVALAFAGFSVATAVLYHSNLGDQIQFLMFYKNIAIAGGFLVLAANSAGGFSIDAHRRK